MAIQVNCPLVQQRRSSNTSAAPIQSNSDSSINTVVAFYAFGYFNYGGDGLMNKIFVFVVLLFTCVIPTEVNAQPVSRDKLLEETLIKQYLTPLGETVSDQFSCERIMDIKRIDGSNREHEVKIEVVTHQGPHNPPNDLVTVTLRDDHNGIRVTDVRRIKNIPTEEVRKRCAVR
jgi:hypothetical protein